MLLIVLVIAVCGSLAAWFVVKKGYTVAEFKDKILFAWKKQTKEKKNEIPPTTDAKKDQNSSNQLPNEFNKAQTVHPVATTINDNTPDKKVQNTTDVQQKSIQSNPKIDEVQNKNKIQETVSEKIISQTIDPPETNTGNKIQEIVPEKIKSQGINPETNTGNQNTTASKRNQRLCIGQLCLDESDIQFARQMKNNFVFFEDGNINLNSRWNLEWNENQFSIRDKSSSENTQFTFQKNTDLSLDTDGVALVRDSTNLINLGDEWKMHVPSEGPFVLEHQRTKTKSLSLHPNHTTNISMSGKLVGKKRDQKINLDDKWEISFHPANAFSIRNNKRKTTSFTLPILQ